jgi:hypothetical protein
MLRCTPFLLFDGDCAEAGAERARFQEFHAMPFGTYGQLYDQYGVQWIFRGAASPLTTR